MNAREEIDGLLAETPAQACAREAQAFFDQLVATDGSVVLHGAGRLGHWCAERLRAARIPLRAVVDHDPRLCGSTLLGVPVLSAEEAAQRYAGSSLFVIAVWSGTLAESMWLRLEAWKQLGCLHVVAFPALAWSVGSAELPFGTCDLPSRLLAHASQLRQLADKLEDGESQRTLADLLRIRLHGDFRPAPPAPVQYFHPAVLRLQQHESVVDAGAYDGDTLLAFLDAVGGRFASYHAFEPDPASRARLLACISALDAEVRARIHVHAEALSERQGALRFTAASSPVSHISAEGEVIVQGVRLDDITPSLPVSLLKVDVEGAEQAVLRGAERTIAWMRPTVACCVYHRPDDIWAVPTWLMARLPDHRFCLRCHGNDGWESVFYAVRHT